MKRIQKRVYQYTAVFEADKDGGYTATIPSLPGCISEGDTFEEAIENIKEAAELYLEDADDSDVLLHEQENIVVAPVRIAV